MTAKNKNTITVFIVIAAIVVVVVLVMKKIKSTAVNLVNETNDIFANTPLGDIVGDRTTAAKGAFARLMKMNFLKHSWITRANAKYNTAEYKMPNPLTTQQATDYARDLKDSKAFVSVDYFNDNARAVSVIMSLKNQVQAAQVADAYYQLGNNKDLNRGLAWLSNTAMVEVADYLATLPTGVFKDNVELKTVTA